LRDRQNSKRRLFKMARNQAGNVPLRGSCAKWRQLPDDDFEGLLDQVVGVVRLQAVPPQPVPEHGPVQGVEALPGGAVVGVLPQPVDEVVRHDPCPLPPKQVGSGGKSDERGVGGAEEKKELLTQGASLVISKPAAALDHSGGGWDWGRAAAG
jgi:hypothetical protein